MNQEEAGSGGGEEATQTLLDVEDIRNLLPHRYPMLLVDRILELEPGKHIVGLKNVTINEPYFNGHFPGLAIMPGVLILEAMAQVAGLMMLSLPGQENMLAYIASIENAQFRKPVVPGDTLLIEATIMWVRFNFGKVRMVARVNGVVHAECDMTFCLRERRSTDQTRIKLDMIRRDANGEEGNSAGGHLSAKPINHNTQDAVPTGHGSRERRGDGGRE
jgi:beta-hydroxyacyl-ACP dehydratase FabZ